MKSILMAGLLGLASASSFASIVNGTFESNNVDTSTNWTAYGYADKGVTADGWKFLGTAGVSSILSDFGGYTPSVAGSSFFGFLQSDIWSPKNPDLPPAGGIIAQTFNLSSGGTLNLSFDFAQRNRYAPTASQTVDVVLNETVLGTVSQVIGVDGSTNWETKSFNTNVSAGTYSLRFIATNLGEASDTTAFIDNVNVSVTAVPEPSTYAMLLAGLGMMGVIARRRTRA